MEIREACPLKTIPPPSVILIENKNIKLAHDECCNDGCSSLQPMYYKYIQPEIAKSFAPRRNYLKPDVPLDDRTTYKLSFWNSPRFHVKPIKQESNLKVSNGCFTDETIHKLSYVGNWCVKREGPIVPSAKQLLGRGPIQSDTTQKCDFTWKNIDPTKLIKERPNIHRPCTAMENNTTYKMSYFNSTSLSPVKSFAPVRQYMKSDVPMDGSTTYKLSYWPNEVTEKENYPWSTPPKYEVPETKMDANTTYSLSYWPHSEDPTKPIVIPDAENLLNAGCCFEDKTTYKLSFFGCGGDRSPPVKYPENINLSTCPLSHDTINRLSYVGNWCLKPNKPIHPKDADLAGQGPLQNETTQKCDFFWKYEIPTSKINPKDQLNCFTDPLNYETTQKLSFMPTDLKTYVPTKSFAPVRTYEKSSVPLDATTIHSLSYLPVEPVEKIEPPWNKRKPYERPVKPIDEYTTYNLSYIPPGQLVPICQQKEKSPPSIKSDSKSLLNGKTKLPVSILPKIKEPYFAPCLMSMPRPCISCG